MSFGLTFTGSKIQFSPENSFCLHPKCELIVAYWLKHNQPKMWLFDVLGMRLNNRLRTTSTNLADSTLS